MKKGDIIIAVVVIVLSAAAIICMNAAAYTHGNGDVVVEIDGREYARYNMKNPPQNPVVIDNEYGYNKIEIEKDGVWVSEADCKDKTDIKSGKISKPGQYIICLPHRLIIRIEGGKNDADAFAY